MIEYEKKFLDIVNGETISYIEKGIENKEKIILIHGNMSSSVHMVTLMDEFKDRYHVIAPDLRGFGDSSFNNQFMTIKELAFDLMLFMERLNLKEAHVLGWSTGFGVAMELAIIAPKKVLSLFSLQGMPVTGYYTLRLDNKGNEIPHTLFKYYNEMKNDPVTKFTADALEAKNYRLVKKIWTITLLKENKIDEELLDLYVKETLKQRCQMNINWAWVNFNISNKPNLYGSGNNQMSSIKCPIYITLALEDNVVTPKMVQNNIDAFDAVVYEFKKGGHAIHLERLDEIVEVLNKSLN